MGIALPTATSGRIPPVEEGLALAIFNDLKQVSHPDWVQDRDNFGNPDDGERFHFEFTLADPDTGEAIYDEGEPLELDAKTKLATGKKSNVRKFMTGLLTKAEFAAWDANQPLPVDPKVGPLEGRYVHLQIKHSDKGWPNIENVVGISKNQYGRAGTK
jgi:hypothetical protein